MLIPLRRRVWRVRAVSVSHATCHSLTVHITTYNTSCITVQTVFTCRASATVLPLPRCRSTNFRSFKTTSHCSLLFFVLCRVDDKYGSINTSTKSYSSAWSRHISPALEAGVFPEYWWMILLFPHKYYSSYFTYTLTVGQTLKLFRLCSFLVTGKLTSFD